MSLFTDAVQYDLENVHFNAFEMAEAAEYTHSGLGETISLTRVIFGDVGVGEVAGGRVADVMQAWIVVDDLVTAASDSNLTGLDGFNLTGLDGVNLDGLGAAAGAVGAADPQKLGTLTRYPGLAAEEIWQVQYISLEGGAWRLDLVKGFRVTP